MARNILASQEEGKSSICELSLLSNPKGLGEPRILDNPSSRNEPWSGSSPTRGSEAIATTQESPKEEERSQV